jgi:hypothetical protein
LVEREKGGVALDLEEVILVDREAVMLLAHSEANGIELRNCPAYIREWVARERARAGSKNLGPEDRRGHDIENI